MERSFSEIEDYTPSDYKYVVQADAEALAEREGYDWFALPFDMQCAFYREAQEKFFAKVAAVLNRRRAMRAQTIMVSVVRGASLEGRL